MKLASLLVLVPLAVPATGAAPGLSIAARPMETVVSGASVTFFGVAGARPGERVSVEAKECGSYGGFHARFGAETGSNGAWSTDPKLFYVGITTTYRARWNDLVSGSVTVRVHPDLRLQRVAGSYELDVNGSDVFRGEVAAIQRSRSGGWLTFQHVTLRSFSGSAEGGHARFKVRLARGTEMRVVLPQTEVGRCYLPGVSNIVRL